MCRTFLFYGTSLLHAKEITLLILLVLPLATSAKKIRSVTNDLYFKKLSDTCVKCLNSKAFLKILNAVFTWLQVELSSLVTLIVQSSVLILVGTTSDKCYTFEFVTDNNNTCTAKYSQHTYFHSD